MNVAYRIVLFPVTFVVVLILFWQTDSDPAPDSDIHLGTWTCESGPPENRLRFWYVETESFTPLVRVFNGRVRVNGLCGMEAADGDWNFGYREPLIVNLSFGDTHGYAAIKKVGHDHLLLRYSTDCDALLHAPFDHPDVLRLRRVADEAE
jgi:hypothetical protein